MQREGSKGYPEDWEGKTIKIGLPDLAWQKKRRGKDGDEEEARICTSCSFEGVNGTIKDQTWTTKFCPASTMHYQETHKIFQAKAKAYSFERLAAKQ